MSNLHPQNLQEFQGIYREVYWEDITEDEASKYATSLLSLMRLALFPKSFDYGD